MNAIIYAHILMLAGFMFWMIWIFFGEKFRNKNNEEN